MPTQDTYYGFIQSRGESPSQENLTEYLTAIPKEDWGAEFKSAVDRAADFLLRRPVAALSNRDGGELFVGVMDSRELVGTPIEKDEFYRRLSQEGSRGDWYMLDLAPLVSRTTPVDLANGQKVLVAEVRKSVIPALVVDKVRGPLWFERRGGSDHELTSYEAVEARRRFERGELLVELYTEFENAVRGIPDHPQDNEAVAPRYFHLPRFDSCRRDGSITSVLTDKDRDTLLVSPVNPTAPSVPGLLQRFLDTGKRIDSDAERRQDFASRYQYVGQSLGEARRQFQQEQRTFADYLRSLGIAIQG